MRFAWLASFVFLGGCLDVAGPYTVATSTTLVVQPPHAKVVFLWPPDSCDHGGYFLVATAKGRFLGTLYRNARLEAELDPGDVELVAWNPEIERDSGQLGPGDVSLVSARLEGGRTYFTRFAFGEWDARGPSGPYFSGGRGVAVRWPSCHGLKASLVALVPGTPEWKRLPDWLDELHPYTADVQGQAWLDADPAVLRVHVQLARERYEALRPEGRTLATLTLGVTRVTR